MISVFNIVCINMTDIHTCVCLYMVCTNTSDFYICVDIYQIYDLKTDIDTYKNNK